MKPLNDDAPYETRAEEAIDWYQHYMAVKPEHLAAEFISDTLHEDREPSVAMTKAMQNRVDELLE